MGHSSDDCFLQVYLTSDLHASPLLSSDASGKPAIRFMNARREKVSDRDEMRTFVLMICVPFL
jgi:hypothetical protein